MRCSASAWLLYTKCHQVTPLTLTSFWSWWNFKPTAWVRVSMAKVWKRQCRPPSAHQHVKHRISGLEFYLIHSGIRHLVTLISNKSGIQPFCVVVETSLTLLAAQVITLHAPREFSILHRYSPLHFEDPEILIAICQQVVQLDLVLFLPCPEDSPGCWTVEDTWSWAAHDRKSVQRAENVPKHASNAHLQLHLPHSPPSPTHFLTWLQNRRLCPSTARWHNLISWSSDAEWSFPQEDHFKDYLQARLKVWSCIL